MYLIGSNVSILENRKKVVNHSTLLWGGGGPSPLLSPNGHYY